MKYHKSSLDNGLRVITVPMPSLESATVTVWVGVGSRYERQKLGGVSHFLEHMIFKGGKKYKSAKEVSEAIDSMGAGNNASTGHEYTNYYVRSSVENLNRAFDILADTVLTPHLGETDLETERGVILEEIAMYEDDPKSYVGILYGNLIFGDTPLGRDVGGTRESVSAMSRKEMFAYHKSHYNSKNMLLTVAGGVEETQVLEFANKYFNRMKRVKSKSIFSKYKHSQSKARVHVLNQKREQTNMIVGFIGNKYGQDDRYAESILSVILSGGMSSRLFTEVREKRGLAYAVSASSSHYMDTGEFSAYAGVPTKKATEALEVILAELYKLATKKHGVTKKEFQKAKDFVKGHTALALESTSYVNSFFGSQELKRGQIETPEEALAKIEKTTVEEVLVVAKELFIKKHLNLVVIGPHPGDAEFKEIVS